MQMYKKIGLGVVGLGTLMNVGCNGTNERIQEHLSSKVYNGVSDNLVLTDAEMSKLKREFNSCHYNAEWAKHQGEHVSDGPAWDAYPHLGLHGEIVRY